MLALTIAVLALAVGIADASFWTLGTMFNIATTTLDNLIFAMGALIVIISGGIDVSFMAIGIFAGYAVVVITNRTGFGADAAWVGFALAAAIGVGLGTLNALAIAGLRLPTLIATLGTRDHPRRTARVRRLEGHPRLPAGAQRPVDQLSRHGPRRGRRPRLTS